MTTASALTTTVRTFQIDPAHTQAEFQVRHLLSRVRGRFTDLSGTIDFDEAAPEKSSVAFSIRTASIDTNQPDRDKHLRSDDFFAVEKYPTLTFTSTGITARSPERYDVTGNLTIRGVTKTVVLPVTYLGSAKDPWGNQKLAFETEITLDRKEYGLVWNAALETGGLLVGDDVRVTVSLQAQPQ
ncbi:MAG TPA: YceI family protein [Vicinamibacterales bacterium]|nr:YceI family protein [Vicinamibacterales bacterium]